VEAMAFGNCVVVNDTPENLETIGDAGFSYSGARGGPALAEVLEGLLAQPALIAQYRRQAQAHAQAHYSWERVTDQYEALLKKCIHGQRQG